MPMLTYRSQEVHLDRSREYGAIVHENVFGIHLVFLYDEDLIEELIKNDGKYPKLILSDQPHFLAARKDLNQPTGLVTR